MTPIQGFLLLKDELTQGNLLRVALLNLTEIGQRFNNTGEEGEVQYVCTHRDIQAKAASSPQGNVLSSISLFQENRKDQCAITHLLLTSIE